MADNPELICELQEINEKLSELKDTIQISTSTIYKGIICAAKIQSAKDAYERNSAIKEADDFIKTLFKEE